MDKWTKPNRPYVVTRCKVTEVTVGEWGGPPAQSDLAEGSTAEATGYKLGEKLWRLDVVTREGLDNEKTVQWFYRSESAALEEKQNWEGIGSLESGIGFPMRFKEMGESVAGFMVYFAADLRHPDNFADDILQEAGLLNADYQLAKPVFDWLDKDNIDWLKVRFDDNWQVAAMMEYCVHHYPKSSLAYLAAQMNVNLFITNDEASYGYLKREIEYIMAGTEEMALIAVQARKKAGTIGGEKSIQRKNENVEIWLQEIENLKHVVNVFSESRILEQALENVRRDNPKFPKSNSTIDGYRTLMRCDEPFKSRYIAVFDKMT